MKLRSLLLAGTVLPFAMAYPVLALERPASAPILLAQTEAPPCPEGQECPPPAQAPAPEQPAAEQPPAEQPAAEQPPAEQPPAEEPAPQEPAAEQPPAEAPAAEEPAPQEAPPAEEPAAAEQPPAEQPAAEQPPVEEPAPQEAPAVEEPAAQEAPAVEQPPAAGEPPALEAAPEQPAAEEPAQDRTRERARRRQQELQQQGEGQQPPPEGGQQQEQATTPPDATPPAEEESTVEQQLEAQGDDAEANKVRSLREQLLDQLQQAISPEDQGGEEQNRRDRRRRGGRDQAGDDRDSGYWNRDEDRGDVVERRGGRIIIDLGGGNLYVEPVVPDDGDRLLYGADDVEVQELPRGRTRTIVHRPDGIDIVTIRDRRGNIIKRSRFLPNGREIVLIDNRYPDEDDFELPPPILLDVPRPRVTIPREEYIVDLGHASDRDIRGALLAPLVEAPPRAYTLDEVLRNEDVRAYSPRIDLDTVTFEFGSATIADDQMGALFALGEAMQEVISENPDEVYLVEAHTDAVGSDYDNLILSDQRAEAVATALSQNFDIPPENLVTEGYGEQYLKVDTRGPDRRNRRATVVRLTELLQAQAQ